MKPDTGIWLLSVATIIMVVLGAILALRQYPVLAALVGFSVVFGVVCILAIYITHYR